MFPSPYGDYGSYRQSRYIPLTNCRKTFPSPYGDYGSYRLLRSVDMDERQRVSVPLRGLWFLSSWRWIEWYSWSRRCFRPLTGIMVLILMKMNWVIFMMSKMFPSPYGDYGSYPMEIAQMIFFGGEFPSPYGDYGSYQAFPNRHYVIIKGVSVPLRGLWFLSHNGIGWIAIDTGVVSVPLRGLWFLSHGRICKGSVSGCIVSVPLRGLWFLSFMVIPPFSLGGLSRFRPLTGIKIGRASCRERV